MFEAPFLLFTATNPYLNSELSLLQGGFYGALTVLGLYNLFLFGFTRSRGYLYYVGFIVSFLLYQMVHNGTALHYIWPGQITLNGYAYPLFFTLNTLAISFFVPSFLYLYEHNSNAFRLFRGYSALILVSMLAFPILKMRIIEPLYNGLSILVTISALVAGIYYWISGNRSARLFSLAWGCYIVGLIIANFGNPHAYPLGALICIILLGVALADRLTEKQKHDRYAHAILLTQQQQSISQLHEYEDIYENSLIGKFQLDSDGYFVRTNAAWRETLGYREKHIFNEENPHFNNLFVDSKQRRNFWRKLKENGQVRAFIATLIQPTGGERVVVSLTIRQSNKNHYAWFGSGQDVTDNYLKEQALTQLQREKAQSLRQLVAGIAGEMAAPLEKLRNAENYLRFEEADLDDEVRQQLTKGLTLIRQGAERFHDINKLMQVSIVQEDQYALADVNIRNWFEEWQQEREIADEKLSIRTAVHSYLMEWPTYPEALEIILNQFIESSCSRNAELYEAAGLKISVELRERGEFLELYYRDNGNIPEKAVRDEIFRPFSHSSNMVGDDQGLGLYQSYNLLTELMQAVVEWPEDEEGFCLLARFNMPTPAKSS